MGWASRDGQRLSQNNPSASSTPASTVRIEEIKEPEVTSTKEKQSAPNKEAKETKAAPKDKRDRTWVDDYDFGSAWVGSGTSHTGYFGDSSFSYLPESVILTDGPHPRSYAHYGVAYEAPSSSSSFADFFVPAAYASSDLSHDTREPFRLRSVLPETSDNPVLAYLYAAGRGIEQGRDMITDAFLHPIAGPVLSATGAVVAPLVRATGRKVGETSRSVGNAIVKLYDAKKGNRVRVVEYSGGATVKNAENTVLFSKSAKIDFAPTGFKDGQCYPPHKQRQLYEYLQKRGADIQPIPLGAQGPGFRARDPKTGKPTLYLPENPTVLEVKNELSHYLDMKQLGEEKYTFLTKLEKE